MQTKTIAEIATFEPVNLVDARRALSCALDVAKGRAQWEPLLLYTPKRKAITGSHRIVAARLVMTLFRVATDGSQLSQIEVPIIDVTKSVDDYCRRYKTGLAFIPFGNLREIFAGTPIEKWARLNKEW